MRNAELTLLMGAAMPTIEESREMAISGLRDSGGYSYSDVRHTNASKGKNKASKRKRKIAKASRRANRC